MIYTYNGILLGLKKEGNSDNATMWTNLMVIILSEINQTKKGETFCDSTGQIQSQKNQKVITRD